MKPTPEMIAAAWGAWKVRHKGSIGPGPGFVEAITAALSAMPAVRVKELEWAEGPFVFAAETTIGTYYIEDQGRNWAGDRYWLTSGFIKIALKFPTLEAAKAAAQADYEARIPAIEPAGVWVETVVKAADSALVSAIRPVYRNGEFSHDELHHPDEVRERVSKAIRASLKGDEQ